MDSTGDAQSPIGHYRGHNRDPVGIIGCVIGYRRDPIGDSQRPIWHYIEHHKAR